MDVSENDLRQILGLLGNATATAIECSTKMAALELSLKSHPEIYRDYQNRLNELKLHDALLDNVKSFEALEKRIFLD